MARVKSNYIPSFALMILAGVALATESTDTPATVAAEPDLEVVLVRGAQPGPALWKVSSGDHVLWILGDVAPLPERVTWRSKKFEKLLANSQEMLLDDSDFLPQPQNRRDRDKIESIRTLPRPLTLEEFISPELLARARAVQRKYDIEVKLEWVRPWSAGGGLYRGACYSLGLVDSFVDYEVRKRARKEKVKVTTISFKPTLAEQINLYADAASEDCLLRVVQILEDGGSGLRRLANAWSLGDIGLLRVLVPKYALLNDSWSPSQVNSCKHGGPNRARAFFEKRTVAWHAEIDRVLRDNSSTMAVMPIGWLLDPKGYVAQLRARGYEVVEPE